GSRTAELAGRGLTWTWCEDAAQVAARSDNGVQTASQESLRGSNRRPIPTAARKTTAEATTPHPPARSANAAGSVVAMGSPILNVATFRAQDENPLTSRAIAMITIAALPPIAGSAKRACPRACAARSSAQPARTKYWGFAGKASDASPAADGRPSRKRTAAALIAATSRKPN